MEDKISKEIYEMLDEAKKININYPQKAYDISEEAYKLAALNKLKLEEGYSLISMVSASRAMSQFINWMENAYKAYGLFKELKHIDGQVRALNLIGIAYFYNAMYEQSIKYLLKAQKILINTDEFNLLSRVVNNMGEVFRELGDYDKAMDYYQRALKISYDVNLQINIATLLQNIGEIYFLKEEYEIAVKYYKDAYEIFINEKDFISLGQVENQIGKIYYINKEYTNAAEYFFNALNRLESLKNKFYVIDVLVNIGILKFQEDFQKSFCYFDRAIEYAETTNAQKKLSNVYKIISELYENAGDLRSSLEFYKKYHFVEQRIATSLIENKLEIIKIELEYLSEDEKYEKAMMLNECLEMEKIHQQKELRKIEQAYKIAEERAFEDELTKIPNRRAINNSLNNLWDECKQKDRSILLFIIDIDYFKKFNDYWGHLEGDECLKKIANCIKNIQTGHGEVFGRYGGEEFVYIAQNLPYDEAYELGIFIKNEVEKLDLKYIINEESKFITISIGGTVGKVENYTSISNIIEIADKELYKAKNCGRNVFLLNNRM